MSNEGNPVDFGSDPLAAAGPDASEESLREYASALVRNGMSVDEANKHLTARKAAPLATNSSELAEQTKERLMGDNDFVSRVPPRRSRRGGTVDGAGPQQYRERRRQAD